MWTVDLSLIRNWIEQQDRRTIANLKSAIQRLEEQGPSLGRPLVDSIKGSKFKNMKELRPVTPGLGQIRILFIFDPWRKAVMLLAGDKSLGPTKFKWSKWYKRAIPEAEARYEQYLRDASKDGRNADNR